ncbi:unnamed protein product, partial [Amoebophrya sp. A25]
VVQELQDGSYFGELCALAVSSKFVTTVIAEDFCACYLLRRTVLEKYIEKDALHRLPLHRSGWLRLEQIGRRIIQAKILANGRGGQGQGHALVQDERRPEEAGEVALLGINAGGNISSASSSKTPHFGGVDDVGRQASEVGQDINVDVNAQKNINANTSGAASGTQVEQGAASSSSAIISPTSGRATATNNGGNESIFKKKTSQLKMTRITTRRGSTVVFDNRDNWSDEEEDEEIKDGVPSGRKLTELQGISIVEETTDDEDGEDDDEDGDFEDDKDDHAEKEADGRKQGGDHIKNHKNDLQTRNTNSVLEHQNENDHKPLPPGRTTTLLEEVDTLIQRKRTSRISKKVEDHRDRDRSKTKSSACASSSSSPSSSSRQTRTNKPARRTTAKHSGWLPQHADNPLFSMPAFQGTSFEFREALLRRLRPEVYLSDHPVPLTAPNGHGSHEPKLIVVLTGILQVAICGQSVRVLQDGDAHGEVELLLPRSTNSTMRPGFCGLTAQTVTWVQTLTRSALTSLLARFPAERERFERVLVKTLQALPDMTALLSQLKFVGQLRQSCAHDPEEQAVVEDELARFCYILDLYKERKFGYSGMVLFVEERHAVVKSRVTRTNNKFTGTSVVSFAGAPPDVEHIPSTTTSAGSSSHNKRKGGSSSSASRGQKRSTVRLIQHNSSRTSSYSNPTSTSSSTVDKNALYVILRGRVRVTVNNEAVATLGEGELLGELRVLGLSSGRTTGAVCDSLCDLAVVHRSVLSRALEDCPKIKAFLRQQALSWVQNACLQHSGVQKVGGACRARPENELTSEVFPQIPQTKQHGQRFTLRPEARLRLLVHRQG